MMDATYTKVRRTTSRLKKGALHLGGWVAPKVLTSKLHGVWDGKGRPVRLHLSKGQCSDCTSADVLLRDLPEASVWLGDKGHDSNKIRTLLPEQGLPPRRNRNKREGPFQQDAVQDAPYS